VISSLTIKNRARNLVPRKATNFGKAPLWDTLFKKSRLPFNQNMNYFVFCFYDGALFAVPLNLNVFVPMLFLRKYTVAV
jgi:aminopeptidase-like protein